MLKQYPFVNPWVTEKMLALVMYVSMVTLALKLARSSFMRDIDLVSVLSLIAYAGTVAVSKQQDMLF